MNRDQDSAAEAAMQSGARTVAVDPFDHAIPLLPGAATAGEAMTLLERGHVFQQFFPAEPAGGLAYPKALRSPLAAVRFCPTGGVTEASAPAYLARAAAGLAG